MSTDTIVILLYGCGLSAMWLSKDDGSDGMYATMLFLFGPLSLAFILITQKESNTELVPATLTRLILSGLYALAFLQWSTGADSLW